MSRYKIHTQKISRIQEHKMSWSMPSNINWSEIDDLYTIVPKGYYKVRIHRTEEIQSKKETTLIKFHCIITEGPHNGSWIHDVMTLPTSADDTYRS